MFRLRSESPKEELYQSDLEEDDYCPPSCKRSKITEHQLEQQWNPAKIKGPNLLEFSFDQPSPLGLTLKKSHSLLDLIQTKLFEEVTESSETVINVNNETGEKNDMAAQVLSDKMKASNFPALALKIGTWECISRYEGDLVVKCLFAKRKFVWEILEGGLKRKIEIHWSEIIDMKTSCPDIGSSMLEIEVSRPPLFFKETSPQPRKHTMWQATSDFTAGQATISKKHFLQFAQGVLYRHYEKIMQSDPRLNLLSNKKEISENPFKSRIVAVHDQYKDNGYMMAQESKSYLLPEIGDENDYQLHFQYFSDTELAMPPTPVLKIEQIKPEYRMVEPIPDLPPFGIISDVAQRVVPILVPKLEKTESESETKMSSSLLEKEISEGHASQCTRNFQDLVIHSDLGKYVQKEESNKPAYGDYNIRALVSRFSHQVCSLFDEVANDSTDYEHSELWFHPSADLLGTETPWADGED